MTKSGTKYSTVKLIMSNSCELYLERCMMHMVSVRPLDRLEVIVPAQMKRGEEYRALATHTATITICNIHSQCSWAHCHYIRMCVCVCVRVCVCVCHTSALHFVRTKYTDWHCLHTITYRCNTACTYCHKPHTRALTTLQTAQTLDMATHNCIEKIKLRRLKWAWNVTCLGETRKCMDFTCK